MKVYIILFSIITFLTVIYFLPSGFKKNENVYTSKIYNNMELKSSSFENNSIIPSKYTCDGENINPELSIKNTPPNTKELVLIVDDPDAPGGTWTHWIVWRISPDINIVNEKDLPKNAIEGITSFGTVGYGGPCPPKGDGKHRYFFTLYALSENIDLFKGATLSDLKKEMNGNVIDSATLVGLYERN